MMASSNKFLPCDFVNAVASVHDKLSRHPAMKVRLWITKWSAKIYMNSRG